MTALEAERRAHQAVRNLCKANKIDARVEAGWIEDGTSLEVIATELLSVMEERGKNTDLAGQPGPVQQGNAALQLVQGHPCAQARPYAAGRHRRRRVRDGVLA